jgi:acyl-CoA hydrolase
MTPRLTEGLRPGMRVFQPTMANQSALLARELNEDPERASGVTFCGVQFPGIDTFDPLAVHPQARQWSAFMTRGLRVGVREGRAALMSMDYLALARYLRDGPPIDLAIAHLSEPDADGWCSPGLSADFLPLVWPRALRRVAHLNPLMPRLPGSFRVHVSELDAHVVSAEPLLDFKEPVAGDIESRIGEHVAGLVRDGDTLQFGIGSVPLALASALTQHRHLRFHGGLISGGVQTLWEAGAMHEPSPITTGVVLGSAALRGFASELRSLWLTSVDHTHRLATLAAIPRFMAINSAVEVDLFGQVNAERMASGLQAGPGGLPAFALGAQASPGGRLLICLPATARGGQLSRIVPSLGADALCTLPRHMADVFVTEFGVADVRDLDVHGRAEALIAVAAPEHRDALANAWAGTRQVL